MSLPATSMQVRSIATAQPEGIIAQQDAARLAVQRCYLTEDQKRLVPVLYRKAGVKSRGIILVEHHGPTGEDGNGLADAAAGGPVLGQPDEDVARFMPAAGDASFRGPTTAARMLRYREESGRLALESAGSALAASGLAASDITHLVTVSCTGFAAPGVDIALISGLGLPVTTARTHVGFMGCHGAINGLRAALAFARAEPGSNVLLCCVEISSIHFFYGWDPEKWVANALFADGSAAVVGTGMPTAQRVESTWKLAACGSCLIPDSQDAMSWHIGDHGFEMSLSSRVPSLISERLPAWIESWLGGMGLRVSDIASWAIHPGGPRIVLAVKQSLGLPEDSTAASQAVLSRCGNMSSPTVLFIVQELMRRDAPRPCVALGFGPGLMAEAALFV